MTPQISNSPRLQDNPDLLTVLTLTIAEIAKRGELAPLVVKVRPDIHALVEPVQGAPCQVSYLLVGTYGNALLGMPSQWHRFDRVFWGSGGLALVFPTEPSRDAGSELELFQRFGPRWVAPDPRAWPHVPAITPTDLSSIRVRGVDRPSDNYRWDIEFKTTRIHVGWQLLAPIPTALLLQRHLSSHMEAVAMSVETSQPAPVAGSPEDLAGRLQHLLASSGHVTWHLPGSALVACFDDIRFEPNDYDILTPRQRYQLAKALRANGIECRTSREWLWRGVSIRIPRAPRLLGANSLDYVNLDPQSIWVLTATQMATHILRTSSLSHQQRAKRLLELVSNLPVNLEKLRSMMLDRFGDLEGIRLLRDLRTNQSETVAYFRRHRVKGLLGKPRLVPSDGS